MVLTLIHAMPISHRNFKEHAPTSACDRASPCRRSCFRNCQKRSGIKQPRDTERRESNKSAQWILPSHLEVCKLCARRLVVSCAGPYGSLKLLQLSGIGPKSVLSRASVQQKVDFPVGQHVQARPVYPIFASYSGSLEPSNNSTLLISQSSRRRWERGDGGVLGTCPIPTNGRVGLYGYLGAAAALSSPFLDQKLSQLACAGNMDPQSTGYLQIKSNNPFESPSVSLGLLKSQVDVHRVVKVAEAMRKIVESMPKENGIKVLPPNDGGV